MKRLKQVFAQRYNRAEGRIGHIWGDRYGSRIVEGEPPADLRGDSDNGVRGNSPTGVRPRYGEKVVHPGFPLLCPLPAAPGAG
jgi:hypothetical protein